jgi:hypothetical protein
MIDRACGVGEAGVDVLAREIGKVRQQFVYADRRGQRVQHVADTHARTVDDRPAAANIPIDDDARAHVRNMRSVGAGVKVGALPLHHSAAPSGPPPRDKLGEELGGGCLRLQ